jgi:hypothetical protein
MSQTQGWITMYNRNPAVFSTMSLFCYDYKWFNVIEFGVTMPTTRGDNEVALYLYKDADLIT